MQCIIQRVSQARLEISGNTIADIERGIVALVGVEKDDGIAAVTRMVERLLSYRIFPDDEGRMNLNVQQINGEILLVPNFTVAADTQKGTRAGFSTAAVPNQGEHLFDVLYAELKQNYDRTEVGVFGADMQITLTNDGPVTFILKS